MQLKAALGGKQVNAAFSNNMYSLLCILLGTLIIKY